MADSDIVIDPTNLDKVIAFTLAGATAGISLRETNEGIRIVACNHSAADRFWTKYESLFREKYRYPSSYTPVDTAPENKVLCVMWGNITGTHEFGYALHIGTTWFIKNTLNVHADGRSCATPTAWRDVDF